MTSLHIKTLDSYLLYNWIHSYEFKKKWKLATLAQLWSNHWFKRYISRHSKHTKNVHEKKLKLTKIVLFVLEACSE